MMTVLFTVLGTATYLVGWFAAGTLTARILYRRVPDISPNLVALAVLLWPFTVAWELMELSVRIATRPTPAQRREQLQQQLSAEYERIRTEADRLGLPLHENASLTDSHTSYPDTWKGYAQ